MDENSIADRIARVRERMEQAAARRGVSAETITLMGVTKKMGAEPIQAAYAAGLRTFGENYIQEALTKVGQPGLDWPDAQWHFIGHLQRNKARDAAGKFALIQSVDSIELARELAKREAQRGRCRRNPAGSPARRIGNEIRDRTGTYSGRGKRNRRAGKRERSRPDGSRALLRQPGGTPARISAACANFLPRSLTRCGKRFRWA